LSAVFLDTFNKLIIITFDNIIEVVSAKTSLIRVTNSDSAIDLKAAQYLPQLHARHARINYKTSETLVTAIDRLISQGLPLRLEIQPDAFAFSSKVANVTGSFAVNYFCKHMHVA
jgi:hypothetical protein